MSPASIIEVLREPVERIATDHLGRPWKATHIQDLADRACHPCVIMSGGDHAFFIKFSAATDGREQFGVELGGLTALAQRAGVRIPTPVGIFAVESGTVLVLEALDEVERSAQHWRDIGRTLGRIHCIKGQQFGWERSGYFGPLAQDNHPAPDWVTFFIERRLTPILRTAEASGHLPVGLGARVERLIQRAPDLCGPAVLPTLLHGDAQKNNFVSTEAGAVVIDPAVYYGNPEVDLAFIDYFEPVPPEVFEGYQDVLPIDPGFWERREFWRLWGYLAAVAVEGPSHLFRLERAVNTYD